MIRQKKTLTFPIWVEGIVILAALGMAVVEGTHDSWLWAVIFGVSGVAFGISLGARLVMGDKHGGA